ncbi:MAG: hypothetical protein CMH83_03095 [Nocardioides sp.]|nr:hypothetical protein [Nocardioides sp.]
MPAMSFDVARARTAVARVVWLVCALFALILAAAALLGALDANTGNELVKFIGDTSDKIDLGFFDLDNPIKDFDTKVDGIEDTKTTLFNYGIAAVVWLVIGRVADRVIRP